MCTGRECIFENTDACHVSYKKKFQLAFGLGFRLVASTLGMRTIGATLAGTGLAGAGLLQKLASLGTSGRKGFLFPLLNRTDAAQIHV